MYSPRGKAALATLRGALLRHYDVESRSSLAIKPYLRGPMQADVNRIEMELSLEKYSIVPLRIRHIRIESCLDLTHFRFGYLLPSPSEVTKNGLFKTHIASIDLISNGSVSHTPENFGSISSERA